MGWVLLVRIGVCGLGSSGQDKGVQHGNEPWGFIKCGNLLTGPGHIKVLTNVTIRFSDCTLLYRLTIMRCLDDISELHAL